MESFPRTAQGIHRDNGLWSPFPLPNDLTGSDFDYGNLIGSFVHLSLLNDVLKVLKSF